MIWPALLATKSCPYVGELPVAQPDRSAGASVDDRAGCAVTVARVLVATPDRPKAHFIFSTQEEFNLHRALVAAEAVAPAIAIQLDLMLATHMQLRGDRSQAGDAPLSLPVAAAR